MAANRKKVFYGRCSTSRQEMSGELQLDAVEEKFGEMAETYFDTAVSGAAPLEKKVELLKCLESLNKGDTLYVYSLSRLSRETLQALFIEKEIKVKGATLKSFQEEEQCGDTPEKKFARTILSAVAELEKEMISARIKSSRQTMRKNGKYLGGKRPFGYKIQGAGMRIKHDEWEVMSQMRKWKDEGMTYQAITNKLNVKDIPSATGGQWHKTAVYRILNGDEHSPC